MIRILFVVCIIMSASLLHAMETTTLMKLSEEEKQAQDKGKFFADGALFVLKSIREQKLDHHHAALDRKSVV